MGNNNMMQNQILMSAYYMLSSILNRKAFTHIHVNIVLPKMLRTCY